MSKTTTQYQCEKCDEIYLKWQGYCDACHEWNTLNEIISNQKKDSKSKYSNGAKPCILAEINPGKNIAIPTQISEFDKVLGEGLIQGSACLLSGDPGIGKSTLSLQVALSLSEEQKCFLISAEESPEQICLRAGRLQKNASNLIVYAQTNLIEILHHLNETKPQFILVDSIQMIYHPNISGTEGSISQVRHSASELISWSKANQTTILFIGHVTKEGGLAGPKALEHLVDIVCSLEGDRQFKYRILRCQKNRFAPTQSIGVFEMKKLGLESIDQPSKIFIESVNLSHPGSVIVPFSEGNRVFLVEIQALVVESGFGMAKRTFVGLDSHRVHLIIAAIDKFLNLKLHTKDVFLTIIGGLKVKEPAFDLGIAVALLSSLKGIALNSPIAVIGEVALTGELRSVSNLNERLSEIAKMGLKKCILPSKAKPTILNTFGLELIYLETVIDVLNYLFK